MATPKKFLFNNRDFSEQGMEAHRQAVINAPPPPPTFTESELDAARQEGYKKGFEQAKHEHEESLELKATQLLSEILLQIQGLVTAETLRHAKAENDALKLSLAMLEQLYPVLLERLAGEQLIYDAQILLAEARGQEDITIHIHPEMMHALSEKFAGVEGIKIVSNTDLSLHDITLNWPHGGAQIKRDDTYKSLQQLVRDTLDGGVQQKPVEISSAALPEDE